MSSAILLAMSPTLETEGTRESPVRERILVTAYDLFARRGVRDVGVNELVDAFLELREQRWTRGWVEAEARRSAGTPEEQLLAIFDLFDEWFHREDFEACSFINVLLELGASHPAGRASIEHLENIRSIVRQLAEEAGLSDPDEFARSWHILMKGSIVSAAEGDPTAAQRAKAMARRLIEDHSHPAPAIAGLA